MKVVSIVEREYVELIMRAALERLSTIEDLMCMIDYSRDAIELTAKNINAENIEDTKNYLESTIKRLDTYMDITNEEMYKIEKSLKEFINNQK